MFKDFAIYQTNTQGVNLDPAVSYVRNGNEITSGGVGNAWVRPYVTFVPDRDSKYLVPAARVQSPALASVGSEHLNAQHLTKWQLERVQSNNQPSTYSPAREVQVVVKPDRLNRIVNPSFETNASFWAVGTNCTIARSTAQAASGTASLALTSVAAGTMSAVVSALSRGPVVVGKRYSAQAQFRAATVARNCRVTLAWYDVNTTLLGTTSGANVSSTTTGWTRATVLSDVPYPNATSVGVYLAVDATAGAGEVHYADTVLLEQADVVGTYFDGTSGDDFVWEVGSTAHNARSYYYENRLDRNEAIIRALRDAVPIGIGIGSAQFGVFTE